MRFLIQTNTTWQKGRFFCSCRDIIRGLRSKVPDNRTLSSNFERGRNWVWFLLPLHPVRSLWDFTHGRLHECKEQPGHVYFDGFDLHSSHSVVGFLVETCSSVCDAETDMVCASNFTVAGKSGRNWLIKRDHRAVTGKNCAVAGQLYYLLPPCHAELRFNS